MYNLLLNLNCAEWTRAILFAEDLLIAVNTASVVVENFTNMEMSKIIQWCTHTHTRKRTGLVTDHCRKRDY